MFFAASSGLCQLSFLLSSCNYCLCCIVFVHFKEIELRHSLFVVLFDINMLALLQAEEAQRLRKKKRAESMRLLDMERRQKQRLEEIRETQKKVQFYLVNLHVIVFYLKCYTFVGFFPLFFDKYAN